MSLAQPRVGLVMSAAARLGQVTPNPMATVGALLRIRLEPSIRVTRSRLEDGINGRVSNNLPDFMLGLGDTLYVH
jgi:hypothetical protein